MTPSFMLTPAGKGILRCRHTGPFSHEDVQALATFFDNYHGKLLIDLTGSTGEECATNIKQFRPILPTAAIFGANIDPAILELSESYYSHFAHEVRYFETEEEALNWLRNQ
ncbi:MAG: STAS/SEC14 domain-containing protein [Chloroflexota bacterium]